MMTTEMKYFVLLFIISTAFGSEETTDIDTEDETTTEELIINENDVDFESEFLKHQQGYKIYMKEGVKLRFYFVKPVGFLFLNFLLIAN